MMYNRGRHPSDTDSVLSETSEDTSRATTQVDSWNDIKSERTFEYQQSINGMDSSDLPPIPDDRSSIVSSTAESINTVVDQKVVEDQIHKKQFNDISTNNQQQPWINPYWGSTWTPNKAENSFTADKKLENATTESVLSQKNIQQLIPGSILINDKGEIDDLSSKNSKSSTLDNSFNPGGQYVADDDGGPGGYLAPTHIQRRIITSSPGLSAHPEAQFGYKRSSSSSDAKIQNRPNLNRQQTFPESTNNNIQRWVNPYCPKQHQASTPLLQNNDTNGEENSLLLNDSIQNSTVNPNSTPNTLGESAPLTVINKSQLSSKTIQSNHQWTNPYWKDKDTSDQNPNFNLKGMTSSSDLKVTPIPTFYERIYPLDTFSVVSVIELDTKTQVIPSDKQPYKNTDRASNVSYLMDDSRIVHYRGEPISSSSPPSVVAPNNVNESADFNPMTRTLQYPSGYPQRRDNLPSSQLMANSTLPSQGNNFFSASYPNNTQPRQLKNLTIEYLSLLNLSAPSNSHITPVLSEDDLNGIQRALRLLETNPNAIPIIGFAEQVPLSNVSNPSKSSTSLGSLFISNDQRQPQSTQAWVSFSTAAASASVPSYPNNLSLRSSEIPASDWTSSYPFNSSSQLVRPSASLLTGQAYRNSPSFSYSSNSQQGQPLVPPPTQQPQGVHNIVLHHSQLI